MNKKASLCMAALLTLRAFANSPHERIPVQPLSPRELLGHDDAYVLQNRVVEAAIFPRIGRLGYFFFRGEPSPFRFDTNLVQSIADNPPAPGGDWRNYGGDWLWPVSQSHWPERFGAHWPPPWIIDGPPWKANGWINHDGSASVALEREIGEPLNIVVRRVFTLPPDAAELTIAQRIERTAPSAVPVTIWNISQIQNARRVALAIETNSSFAGGYRVLDFAPPSPDLLHNDDPIVLVVDTFRAGEIKIGSDSPRAWIAAQRDDVLIFERALGRPDATTFPDGGCRVELYANSGLGYAEIETLSEERLLAPGEAIENVLTISLRRVPADMTDAEFAARARSVAGESAARPVTE